MLASLDRLGLEVTPNPTATERAAPTARELETRFGPSTSVLMLDPTSLGVRRSTTF